MLAHRFIFGAHDSTGEIYRLKTLRNGATNLIDVAGAMIAK
jgi:hypothetical protein